MEPWMIGAATALVSGGAAWGSARVALNGTRERVKDLKYSLDEHIEHDSEVQTVMVDRLARIETKLDLLMEKRR